MLQPKIVWEQLESPARKVVFSQELSSALFLANGLQPPARRGRLTIGVEPRVLHRQQWRFHNALLPGCG
ncbi:MAG: hypothetical protein WAL04_02160, partial [Acidimicrobiales bacterium]